MNEPFFICMAKFYDMDSICGALLILFGFGHIWLLAWGTCVESWGGVFVFFICYFFRGLDELGLGGVGRG